MVVAGSTRTSNKKEFKIVLKECGQVLERSYGHHYEVWIVHALFLTYF